MGLERVNFPSRDRDFVAAAVRANAAQAPTDHSFGCEAGLIFAGAGYIDLFRRGGGAILPIMSHLQVLACSPRHADMLADRATS